ncbi:MAG: DMP19 family protein [Planctomycetales bacterium]|nr:DMP19 family protein [Planctomycetales bacterium]
MEFKITPRPPTPERITRALLTELPDETLEYSLTSYALAQVGDDLSYENPKFRELPEGLQAYLVVAIVDGELGNGGFNQFFFNSSGQLGLGAPAAFEFFGLPNVAVLMRDALRLLVARAPILEDARRQGTMEAFMATYRDNPFEALDRKYYELEAEVRSACVRYIRAHPDQFLHP